MKFVDDDERTWQDAEIERLETRVTDLILENNHLRRNLDHKGHSQTLRENEVMKMELKNMYALEEENKDLRTELEIYKRAGLDDTQKKLKLDNENLQKRNGHLLAQVLELEKKLSFFEKNKL